MAILTTSTVKTALEAYSHNTDPEKQLLRNSYQGDDTCLIYDPYWKPIYVPANRLDYYIAKTGFHYADASAALTGTAIASGVLESEIVTGGETIIITLTDVEWVADGAAFDAVRQSLINGMDSAQAQAGGWDAKLKAVMEVTTVVRTSDTVVTVTLPATGDYSITANETITVTIPSAAIAQPYPRDIAAGSFVITHGS